MQDRYLKAVLTVIAAALVGLLVQNTIRPVGAANDIQRVMICDFYNPNRCARVLERGSHSDTYNSNFLLSK
jgi:hypothetical protein